MTVMLATLIELEAIQEELPVFPSAKEVKFLLTFGDLLSPLTGYSDVGDSIVLLILRCY